MVRTCHIWPVLLPALCSAARLGEEWFGECIAELPMALQEEMYKWNNVDKKFYETGGAISIRGSVVDRYHRIEGEKVGLTFNSPPGWAAPSMFHAHPINAYFVPSAADYEAVLREQVANLLNKDYQFCKEGYVCRYPDWSVCDSFMGRKKEVVFAPNGIYVYGPTDRLVQQVADVDDMEGAISYIHDALGSFNCENCWPKCGRKKCHFAPHKRGKGNYNISLTGPIQPYSTTGEISPQSMQPESHQALKTYLLGVGFELDFYPYGSRVCLGFLGSEDPYLDPFQTTCVPEDEFDETFQPPMTWQPPGRATAGAGAQPMDADTMDVDVDMDHMPDFHPVANDFSVVQTFPKGLKWNQFQREYVLANDYKTTPKERSAAYKEYKSWQSRSNSNSMDIGSAASLAQKDASLSSSSSSSIRKERKTLALIKDRFDPPSHS